MSSLFGALTGHCYYNFLITGHPEMNKFGINAMYNAPCFTSRFFIARNPSHVLRSAQAVSKRRIVLPFIFEPYPELTHQLKAVIEDLGI